MGALRKNEQKLDSHPLALGYLGKILESCDGRRVGARLEDSHGDIWTVEGIVHYCHEKAPYLRVMDSPDRRFAKGMKLLFSEWSIAEFLL